MVADRLQRFQRGLGVLGLVLVFGLPGLRVGADDVTTIRVGVRTDAAPFSERVTKTPPQIDTGPCDEQMPLVTYRGYSVDLCRDFIGHLQTRHPGKLDYCFVEVVTYRGGNVPNRFEALESGEIDILCGATTATLEVQSRFRTSLPTFLSTSTFLYNVQSVSERVDDQVPLRIGVLSNSTSDERTNPDAEIQQVAVRTALGSVGVMPPVTFNSHLDVPEMLCTPNRDRTGCEGSATSAEGANAADAPLAEGPAGDGHARGVRTESDSAAGATAGDPASNDCGWQMHRSLVGWARYLQCPEPWAWFGELRERLATRWPIAGDQVGGSPSDTATAAEAPPGDTATSDGAAPAPAVASPDDVASVAPAPPRAGAIHGSARLAAAPAPDAGAVPGARDPTEDDAPQEGDPEPSQFALRRVSGEIDVYISDRPILEAILKRAKNEENAAGIELSSEVLISQPYAIVFPTATDAALSDVAAFGDLHLEFNRFLVEQYYSPQQREALVSRLKRYFATTVDRSFINMLPILARWPTGASFDSTETDPGLTETEIEATGGN